MIEKTRWGRYPDLEPHSPTRRAFQPSLQTENRVVLLRRQESAVRNYRERLRTEGSEEFTRESFQMTAPRAFIWLGRH